MLRKTIDIKLVLKENFVDIVDITSIMLMLKENFVDKKHTYLWILCSAFYSLTHSLIVVGVLFISWHYICTRIGGLGLPFFFFFLVEKLKWTLWDFNFTVFGGKSNINAQGFSIFYFLVPVMKVTVSLKHFMGYLPYSFHFWLSLLIYTFKQAQITSRLVFCHHLASHRCFSASSRNTHLPLESPPGDPDSMVNLICSV